MSKGLDALEKIKPYLEIIDGEDGECWGTGEYQEQEALDIIVKSLKALEIIKDKEVNVNHLVISDTLDMYNYGWEEYLCILNQEEFDFLKRVFSNE